jgi:hypothetical protein
MKYTIKYSKEVRDRLKKELDTAGDSHNLFSRFGLERGLLDEIDRLTAELEKAKDKIRQYSGYISDSNEPCEKEEDIAKKIRSVMQEYWELICQAGSPPPLELYIRWINSYFEIETSFLKRELELAITKEQINKIVNKYIGDNSAIRKMEKAISEAYKNDKYILKEKQND